MNGTLKLTAQGDREIVMTRTFDAPRGQVFDAWTKPELVRRWLLGPDGWSMPVCEIDLKPGGAYHWVWRNDAKGIEMSLRGDYREVAPPERIVHTERWDQPWYPGEALIATVFAEQAGKTTVTMTMQMASREAREAVLKSGMESGVARSYDRLAELLAEAGAAV